MLPVIVRISHTDEVHRPPTSRQSQVGSPAEQGPAQMTWQLEPAKRWLSCTWLHFLAFQDALQPFLSLKDAHIPSLKLVGFDWSLCHIITVTCDYYYHYRHTRTHTAHTHPQICQELDWKFLSMLREYCRRMAMDRTLQVLSAQGFLIGNEL